MQSKFFYYCAILLCISLLVLTACNTNNTQDTHTFRGTTMGTLYTVKIVVPENNPVMHSLNKQIDATLTSVNHALSNWQKDSELSAFNDNTSTNWVEISSDFYQVMDEANKINQQSNEHFDVTLAPLINLWGFGPETHKADPTQSQIDQALHNVGQSHLIEITKSPLAIRKKQPQVTVNLSAIAKGYGVDKVAHLLTKQGIRNFLVEIGGDLITHGVNAKGESWRVGIEKPNDVGQSVDSIISLNNSAIATSGDYRNYHLKNGERLSHIINPVTGHPVTHHLASVSVISNTAMRADGLATAILVLGKKEGLKLADKLNISAYFIERINNSYITSSSKQFRKQYPHIRH